MPTPLNYATLHTNLNWVFRSEAKTKAKDSKFGLKELLKSRNYGASIGKLAQKVSPLESEDWLFNARFFN